MEKYRLREALPAEVQDKLKGYPPLLQSLLYYRGIDTADKAADFLNPSYTESFHDPFCLMDMDKAADRVIIAVKNNERILIYSDYDADGIPAAVIMHDFFRLIKYDNVEFYIPHRHNEGFGLHLEAVDTFKDRVKLLITLDCGITDISEVKHASSHGMDVIITDHHEPGQKLPEAYAIVNAKQQLCGYPFDHLCGAGVAFKLVQAILKKERFSMKEGKEKWLLDMAGLATLSDMVPLYGENRAFAHFGLKVLRKTRRPGLLHLFRKLNINPAYLTEDDIGFMITPRINAASRMGIPQDAFDLLSTTDEVKAGELAEHLDRINNERKGLVASHTKEIKKIIKEREEHYADLPIIILGNPDWRPAILGLVANAIAEAHNKPVFLWGKENGKEIKGSCRSDGRVDLTKLMDGAKEVFTEYGGHTMSGGFAVKHELIHVLEEKLLKAYERSRSVPNENASQEDIVYADAGLTLDEVTAKTSELVEKLAPFGKGNPKPLFMLRGITPSDIRTFGKANDHLELTFNNSKGYKVKAISFFAGPDDFSYKPEKDRPLNLIATIEKSYFRNRPEIRLRIVDIV